MNLKTVYKVLASLCMLALVMSFSVTALAAGGPGPEDIAATGDETRIVMPDASSYLPEYRVMYINAEKYLSISGYSQPSEGMQLPQPIVFHGSRVIVLAEQDGFYCVRYRTASLATVTAWFPESFLSEDYPGETITIGASSNSGSPLDEDPSFYWSWEDIPNTAGRYLRVAEPCENCTGFTLDYQVINYIEKDLDDIMGPRVVSVDDGENWVELGRFDYTELGPVHVVVNLDKATSISAVRALPICEKPDSFLARMDVLDVYTA